MSQVQNSSKIEKQLVVVVSRFGQVQAVYSRYEDAEILIKDSINKQYAIDVTVKFLQ